MAKATHRIKEKSEEQQHYESMISFLKWGIGIAGSLIAIIAAVAITVSYNSIKDLKTDMSADLKDLKNNYSSKVDELKSQIIELKSDAKETVLQIKDDSKDAVESTKEYSEKEISRISTSTSQIALGETQKQLDNIFATDKIQNLIQTQAVKEIKSKVVDIVAEQTKEFGNISDAAAQVRAYRFSGLRKLRSYFINSRNPLDSLIAKNLYDQISIDFYNQIESQVKEEKKDFLKFDSSAIQDLRNGKLPTNQALLNEISSAISNVNSEEYDLFSCIYSIYELRILTNIKFEILDIDTVNKWYKNLKK